MEMNLTHAEEFISTWPQIQNKPKRIYFPQMASLMFKKSSSKKDVVGKSKHEIMMIKCKKHPKHKQSPGVCSLCLREKLYQLSSTSSSSSRTTLESYCSSSSSLSSYYSSASTSSCSSPVYKFTTDHKGKNSLSTSLFGGGKTVLTKSRSLAFVQKMKNKQVNESKKKQNGIFSKLLRPRNNKKIDHEGLIHSRTLKEIVVTT